MKSYLFALAIACILVSAISALLYFFGMRTEFALLVLIIIVCTTGIVHDVLDAYKKSNKAEQ